MVTKKQFVNRYAHRNYSFTDIESSFIVKKIYKYVRGKRVLDLGCGPVVPVTSLFYKDAQEVVAVDKLKENIDFIKYNKKQLEPSIHRALTYRNRYLFKRKTTPKIILKKGDVTKKLPIGKFNSVMQIGCFGALDTNEQFQKAVTYAYSYLKKGGNFLMVNWIGEVKRPYNFNGKVDELELYKPSLKHAGFKITELHTTSKLSKGTKTLGYKKIIWAVAKK